MSNPFIKSSLLVSLWLNLNTGFGQDLQNVELSDQDRLNGIERRYEYQGKVHFSCVLLLYKNGKYRYEEEMMGVKFNIGTWSQEKGEILFKDDLDKNNLPISLKYLEKIDSTQNFVIQIVRNLKSDFLTDGMVYINNDSNQCLPLTGTCLQNFKNIDSLKFVFENGYRSRWIKTTRQDYVQILPILQTDHLMYTYSPLRYFRYKKIKSGLSPQR